MDVLLPGRREADLDDEGDVGVVQATGGHVGGHHDALLRRAEGVGGFSAVPLGLARVNLCDVLAERDE